MANYSPDVHHQCVLDGLGQFGQCLVVQAALWVCMPAELLDATEQAVMPSTKTSEMCAILKTEAQPTQQHRPSRQS